MYPRDCQHYSKRRACDYQPQHNFTEFWLHASLPPNNRASKSKMRLYATSSLKGFQGGGSAEPLVCLREKDIFERRESDTTGGHRSFLKLSPDRSMRFRFHTRGGCSSQNAILLYL